MRAGDRYIDLTFSIWEEGDQFAAECLELGTATCAESFEDARDGLLDAVVLHLNTLEEIGERARFFRERGIRVRTYRPAMRRVAVKVNVPPGTWASRERVPV